jgi:hypothetical protein
MLFCQKITSTSKTKTIAENQFLIFSFKDLHQDLKLPAEQIKVQNVLRLAGALVYPLFSICGLPFFLLWTPICVGTHHAFSRFAYWAALDAFKAGDILVDPDLNHEIKLKMASRKVYRFHINYNGDLVIHMNQPMFFSLSKFKGIDVLKEPESNLITNKINAVKTKLFPNANSQISYFHLEDDIQKQVQSVMIARQLRFRVSMGSALAGSLIVASYWVNCDLLKDLVITFHVLGSSYECAPYAFLQKIAIATIPLFLVSMLSNHNIKLFDKHKDDFSLTKYTDNLWDSIHKKNEFRDIIKPKFRDFYQQSDFKTIEYLSISTFGNIQYYDRNSFSFRKKAQYKADKNNGNE